MQSQLVIRLNSLKRAISRWKSFQPDSGISETVAEMKNLEIAYSHLVKSFASTPISCGLDMKTGLMA